MDSWKKIFCHRKFSIMISRRGDESFLCLLLCWYPKSRNLRRICYLSLGSWLPRKRKKSLFRIRLYHIHCSHVGLWLPEKTMPFSTNTMLPKFHPNWTLSIPKYCWSIIPLRILEAAKLDTCRIKVKLRLHFSLTQVSDILYMNWRGQNLQNNNLLNFLISSLSNGWLIRSVLLWVLMELWGLMLLLRGY